MRGCVLLIVLGEATHRNAFNDVLSDTLHRLIYALDGADGYSRYHEVKPDIVLAYVRSDRIDGRSLCQMLRQEGVQVPVVLYGEDVIDHRPFGASGFLKVPFDATTLAGVIGPYLRDPEPPGAPTDSVTAVVYQDQVSGRPAEKSRPPALVQDETPRWSEGSLVAETLLADEVRFDPAIEAAARTDSMVESEGDTADLPADPPQDRPDAFTQDTDEMELPAHVGRSIPEETGEAVPIFRAPPGLFDRPDAPRQESPKRFSLPPGNGAPPRRNTPEGQLGKQLAERVAQTFALLDQLDYYELMGVDASASSEQIHAAYVDRSLEFHPDRFFLLTTGDMKEKIGAIYRRIGDANTVLSDPKQRAAYDATALKPERVVTETSGRIPFEPRKSAVPGSDMAVMGLDSNAVPSEASEYIRLAQASCQRGDLNGAKLFLGLALVYVPNDAALRNAIDEITRVTGV